MHPRAVARVFQQIADLLELRGQDHFRTAAYRNTARAVSALDSDDVAPLLQNGELARVPGIGPATLGVIGELVETGESTYLEQLREDTPDGLVEMLRIPSLGPAKIHAIHEGLGVETVHELEAAARDGRLAALPKFGPRTAEKIRRGIAYLRETNEYVLYAEARVDAERLRAEMGRHPGVERVEIAGSIRRRCEIVRDVDLVIACREAPAAVAAALARGPAVREALGTGGPEVSLRLVDGTRVDVFCTTPETFAIALWRATGSASHEREIRSRTAARGLTLVDDRLRDAAGHTVPVPDEAALYRAVGLPYIEPELREGTGEVDAAARGTLPMLIAGADIRGALHCHSSYSDGAASVAEMAAAARARGWSYVGISDHSQSAFYAGGLTGDAVRAQHDEIDRVNASQTDVRVLKGIEADILADGRVDYDADVLDRFDYVIASVHSRFSLDQAAMTERVLRALDDPHVTIVGHPTGRLLLARQPFALDMDAVLEKAAEVGVAIELNADPHRLDIDWQYCRAAKGHRCMVEIGPDAHSTNGLDNMAYGIGIARKGWLERADVLNTRAADEVLAWARHRRDAVVKA